MDIFILALLWTAWCFLHSAMISVSVTEYLKGRLGDSYRFYRLIYVIVTVVTLLPILIFSNSVQSPEVFSWNGSLVALRMLLVIASIGLFYAGAKHYDGLQFIGIRQIREKESRKGLTETGGIDTTGILGVVRHPWYTGGIFIIWAARNLDLATLVVNVVLTAYILIGTVLEERKLALEFGDEYKEYQKKVSMFLPAKWVRSRLNG
ncbi:MAG: isoprenylcysteine carboxylmethyltransferase family protein [bacterium]